MFDHNEEVFIAIVRHIATGNEHDCVISADNLEMALKRLEDACYSLSLLAEGDPGFTHGLKIAREYHHSLASAARSRRWDTSGFNDISGVFSFNRPKGKT